MKIQLILDSNISIESKQKIFAQMGEELSIVRGILAETLHNLSSDTRDKEAEPEKIDEKELVGDHEISDLFEVDEYLENYVFPPENLTNKELNKELLPILTPELFIFIRTITHPYRTVLKPEYSHYFDYLIDVEDWKVIWIKYLLQGTEAEGSYEFRPYDEIYEDEINMVDKIIESFHDLLETQKRVSNEIKNLIEIELSEKEFKLTIPMKKILIYKDWVLSEFIEFMDKNGFKLNPILLDQDSPSEDDELFMVN